MFRQPFDAPSEPCLLLIGRMDPHAQRYSCRWNPSSLIGLPHVVRRNDEYNSHFIPVLVSTVHARPQELDTLNHANQYDMHFIVLSTALLEQHHDTSNENSLPLRIIGNVLRRVVRMCDSSPLVLSSSSLYLNAGRRYHVIELLSNAREGGAECGWNAPAARAPNFKAAGADPERDEAADKEDDGQPSTNILANEASQGASGDRTLHSQLD
ncbi:hypothetical protein EDD85DRAFT_932402 [Armillaria nabsnona]|nr:hypothetical protein EDD85DRAFT_932402 [Armillaria nabsnona]